MDFNEEHPWNINLILVTLDVSNSDISTKVKELQLANIYSISSVEEVSKFFICI